MSGVKRERERGERGGWEDYGYVVGWRELPERGGERER